MENLMMNKQQLIEKILQHDQRISQAGLKVLLPKIELMSDDIRMAFENWLETDQIAGINIEGFSVESLMNSYNLSPIAAFMTLDYLRRKPQEAKQALQRGYDRVQTRGGDIHK